MIGYHEYKEAVTLCVIYRARRIRRSSGQTFVKIMRKTKNKPINFLHRDLNAVCILAKSSKNSYFRQKFIRFGWL